MVIGLQSMYKSGVCLLDDLHAHIKLLHTPERAQASADFLFEGGGRAA